MDTKYFIRLLNKKGVKPENKKRRSFTDEYKKDVIRMHEEQSIPIRRLSIDFIPSFVETGNK